ncbi:DnaA ATPase domain-containing protein [Desulfosporosinus youngiae]|uniref:ATPase involved in DNA replication initiation n=1 Tax=Desulfosporosinus youngiae DSM 17734 TaxID=768710 RepID=H5Y541_9FIRM|nr:DnaA/Hda family protein [Desulfosporosinus youngiae]EHQ90145.1 ATPase involved in DNA replication initiation [Desulfosporosinus youngiae DSM 17734]
MNWFISDFNIRACRLVKYYKLEKAPDVTLLYGPRGVGKSALLRYLYQKNEPEQGMLMTDALAFARQYAYSAQENKLDVFRKRHRSVRLLLIDDLQFLAGKAKTIEELHYTYEYIIENGGKMVITMEADLPVLDFLGERLASRFLSGVVIPIAGPETDELERFLEGYIREKRLFMDTSVLSLIAGRTDNLADALLCLRKFIQFAELQQEELSLTCFQAYWEQEESKKNNSADPMNIIRNVSETMGIPVEELLSASRKTKVNEAREMAIYIIRTLCNCSYPEIGRYFNRNHNTIIMSHKKMQGKLAKDQELKTKYELILNGFQY